MSVNKGKKKKKKKKVKSSRRDEAAEGLLSSPNLRHKK
jgi:hypothetical protein